MSARTRAKTKTSTSGVEPMLGAAARRPGQPTTARGRRDGRRLQRRQEQRDVRRDVARALHPYTS